MNIRKSKLKPCCWATIRSDYERGILFDLQCTCGAELRRLRIGQREILVKEREEN